MAQTPWQIQLLGELRASYRDRVLPRFETRKAAILFVRLALGIHRSHPREELMEALWPDEDPDATRVRFRQVLMTLRRTLVSSGAETEEVLVADRASVRLNAALVTTDVSEIENALRIAAHATTATDRVNALRQAVEWYSGDLLPGYYEEWVLSERERLRDLHSHTLVQLVDTLQEIGKLTDAAAYARKAVAADPLREENHAILLRLTIAAGRTSEAVRQFRELEQILWRELRTVPTDTTRALIEPFLAETPPPFSLIGTERIVVALHPAGQEPEVIEAPQSETVAAPSRLAAPLSAFFGRDRELGEIVGHFRGDSGEVSQGRRLLTVTGPGGTGKTRLALEVVRLLEPTFRGRVFWVPLVDVSEAASILDTIADTLRPHRTPTSDPVEQIALLIRGEPTLIALDNFEHLADEGAVRLRSLLERVPTLRCLVTSRRRLDIEGEQEYTIGPLTAPQKSISGEEMTPEVALTFPSVQLFVDRARRAEADFSLNRENTGAVVALCTHLEGIPLALELAAGWASVLSPQQITERLGDRFQLLVTRRSDQEERHRSLRSTLEWSVDRLPEDLVRFLARLSVFRGGWTLEAAEAVAEDAETAGRTLDFLAQLRRHSLVFIEGTGSNRRFRMLETVREYTVQLLPVEEREPCERRHALFFLRFVQVTAPHVIGQDTRLAVARLDEEYQNLRAALTWCAGVPEGDPEAANIGMGLIAALRIFWEQRNYYTDAEYWIDLLLTRAMAAEPLIRAIAWREAGAYYGNRHIRTKAFDLLEAAQAEFEALGDTSGVAWTLYWLGSVLRDDGQLERSRTLLDRCLTLMESQREAAGIARAQAARGSVAAIELDTVAAYSLMEEAAARYRILGHLGGVAWSLGCLAKMEMDRGNLPIAEALYQEAVSLARATESRYYARVFLMNLSDIAYLMGDLPRMYDFLKEAVAACEAEGDGIALMIILMGQGDTCRRLDMPAEALSSYRSVLRLAGRLRNEPALAAALARLGDCAWEGGNAKEAALLLGAAEGVLASRPNTQPLYWFAKEDLPDVEPEMLRAALGDVIFRLCWQEGKTQTPEQMLRFAESGATSRFSNAPAIP